MGRLSGIEIREIDDPHLRVGGVDAAPIEHLGETVFPPRTDGDGGAGGGEAFSNCGTDAGRRPRDEGSTSTNLERHAVIPPPGPHP